MDGGKGKSATTEIKSEAVATGLKPHGYKLNEKCFCIHKDFIYEARIIAIGRGQKEEPSYLIHYHGWSKKWDEWVTEDRMLEYNPDNSNIYDEQKKKISEINTCKKRVSGGTIVNNLPTSTFKEQTPTTAGRTKPIPTSETLNDTASAASDTSIVEIDRNRKRRRRQTKSTSALKEDIPNEIHSDYHMPPLPDSLKELLAQDYAKVKEERKLFKLPPTKTINDLLDDYIEDRSQKELQISEDEKKTLLSRSKLEELNFSNDPENFVFDSKTFGPNYLISCYKEFCQSLRDYFKTFLSTQLLYDLERYQYSNLLSCDTNQLGKESESSSKMQKSRKSSSSQASTVQMNVKSKKTSSVTTNSNNKSSHLCDLYAPIHLLRLFTKLEIFLRHFDADEGLLHIIDLLLEDFIEFMDENREHYFNDQYYEVTDDYLEKASTLLPKIEH